jgi:hypothetical protein
MAAIAMAVATVVINNERNPSSEKGKGSPLYIAYGMRGFSYIPPNIIRKNNTPPNMAFSTAVYLIWLAI